jgi:methionine-gamma-lyase
MKTKSNSKTTQSIHAGNVKDQFGSVITPVYRTSTFEFESVDQGAKRFKGEEGGYIYTRLGNPTTDALARKIATLEKAEACVMTASGMGAIASVM